MPEIVSTPNAVNRMRRHRRHEPFKLSNALAVRSLAPIAKSGSFDHIGAV
jgi:hypothetical protein